MTERLQTENVSESMRKNAVRSAMEQAVSYVEIGANPEHFPTPYVCKYTNGEQTAIGFGSAHTNTPNHPQYKEMESLLETYQPVVFLEGMRGLQDEVKKDRLLQHVAELNETDAVQKGEIFYCLWRAVKLGCEVQCAEPGRTEIYQALMRSNYPNEGIFIEAILSLAAQQWDRHGRQGDLAEYLQERRELLCDTLNLNCGGHIFDQIELYARIIGLDDLADRSNWFKPNFIEQLITPNQIPETPYTIINEISAASSILRDERWLGAVYDSLQNGDSNVMVVYGSNHIHRCAPALEHLIKRQVP